MIFSELKLNFLRDQNMHQSICLFVEIEVKNHIHSHTHKVTNKQAHKHKHKDTHKRRHRHTQSHIKTVAEIYFMNTVTYALTHTQSSIVSQALTCKDFHVSAKIVLLHPILIEASLSFSRLIS